MDSSGPFRPVGPDRLQAREGDGCFSLFGLPFLLAGLFVTLIGLRIVPVENAADLPAWAWPLLVLMGLSFAAVGGYLVFGRRWVTLDAGRGVVRKEWGLLVPLQGEEHPLADFDAVILRFEAGGSDTADRYPVLLRGRSGTPDCPLSNSTQYGESREGAATVAKFLGLPLVDAATQRESTLAADRVDETFQERLTAGEGRDEAAVRPLRLQSQVRESSRAVEIVLPGPGFKPGKLVGLAVSLGILLYVAPRLLRFFRDTQTPEGVQLVFFAFVALILVVIPLLGVLHSVLLAARGRTLITASPDGILIEERGAWRAKTTRIPAADIFGLDHGTAEAAFSSARRAAEERADRTGRRMPRYGERGGPPPRWLALVKALVTSKGVIVKSRSGLVTFGAGLPDAEVRYLCAAVTRALGSARGGRW